MTAPRFKTAAELLALPASDAPRRLFEGCHLHYNGPGSSGFGVKRTAMLMPETAMLMVSPMGCGRSGTAVAERFGFAERMFYLELDDRTVASGSYLAKIPEAVRYIAGLGRFRAVLICMSCIDALTGTDLAGIGRRAAAESGIAVTTTFMDPIVRDGNFGPMVQVRQAITACFEGGEKRPDRLNLLGVFAPPEENGELSSLARIAGIGRVLSVAGCRTFGELRAMGRSGGNLIVNRQAAACGADLQKRLHMPYLESHTQYTPDGIARAYGELGAFLGAELPFTEYEDAARAALADFSARRAGKRVAVGEAVCGSPFDIACLLLAVGLEVPFVFRNVVFPSDREALERLCALAPETRVYSGVHPDTFFAPEELPEADLALGADAGYFLKSAACAAWPWERTYFGFEALRELLSLLDAGFERPAGFREQTQGSYLTV